MMGHDLVYAEGQFSMKPHWRNKNTIELNPVSSEPCDQVASEL